MAANVLWFGEVPPCRMLKFSTKACGGILPNHCYKPFLLVFGVTIKIKKIMNDVWDFIEKADKKRQIIGDIRAKEQKINELPKICGSCDLWMTTQCKREKTRKVSNGMPICSDFQQQKWVTDFISKLQVELSELRSVLNGL